jgi:hypothetical protein
MAPIEKGRMTVEIDGPFVVFIIGLRIHAWWKVHKWLPVVQAMPRMLKELAGRTDTGFLGAQSHIGAIVQYWRSFDDLERYARDHDAAHWPAWVAFNKKVGAASGDIGIWHETYRVEPGQYEAIYVSTRPIGLGKVGRRVPAAGRRESARGRLSAS